MTDAFGFPCCCFCDDTGLTLDDYNGFRFCTCEAGIKRKLNEPNVTEELNAQRIKLGISNKKA